MINFAHQKPIFLTGKVSYAILNVFMFNLGVKQKGKLLSIHVFKKEVMT